jgi:predicted ribosomally synthesized peptide with nif11-like leader
MSQKKAQEFIRRAGTEKNLANTLNSLKSKSELLEVARSFGYDFTVEELKLAIVQTMNLQDEDLDAVTGGGVRYGDVLVLVNLLEMKSA